MKQAERLRKSYSNRDLQEMNRICRMLSDEDVFRRTSRTLKYRDIWQTWLETKGPDIAIIFA